MEQTRHALLWDQISRTYASCGMTPIVDEDDKKLQKMLRFKVVSESNGDAVKVAKRTSTIEKHIRWFRWYYKTRAAYHIQHLRDDLLPRSIGIAQEAVSQLETVHDVSRKFRELSFAEYELKKTQDACFRMKHVPAWSPQSEGRLLSEILSKDIAQWWSRSDEDLVKALRGHDVFSARSDEELLLRAKTSMFEDALAAEKNLDEKKYKVRTLTSLGQKLRNLENLLPSEVEVHDACETV